MNKKKNNPLFRLLSLLKADVELTECGDLKIVIPYENLEEYLQVWERIENGKNEKV